MDDDGSSLRASLLFVAAVALDLVLPGGRPLGFAATFAATCAATDLGATLPVLCFVLPFGLPLGLPDKGPFTMPPFAFHSAIMASLSFSTSLDILSN